MGKYDNDIIVVFLKIIVIETNLKGGDNMEYVITDATWAWLMVPMLSIIILSVVTYFTEKGEG